tara:strand:+ start:693 stop:959 length:267 start_codon:yes stop_codon:yes gene_type:complete
MMLSEKIKDFLTKLLIVIFLFFIGYYFLMGSSTQTPEEFDKEFIEKFDACVERAKNRCDEGISETACTDYAMNRCETFLGTRENPIIK